MPVRRIGPNYPEPHPKLVERLASELLVKEGQKTVRDAPFVVEEIVGRGDKMHVLVIWDAWNGVAVEDRGRVIMDAYRSARGEEEMRNITLPMGLTYAEASKMQIGPEDIVRGN